MLGRRLAHAVGAFGRHSRRRGSYHQVGCIGAHHKERRSLAGKKPRLEEQLQEVNENAEAGNVTACKALFESLPWSSIGQSTRNLMYKTVLKAYANAGDYEGAVSWYATMLRNSVQANYKTFGKLAESATKAGLPDESEAWTCRLLSVAGADHSLDELGEVPCAMVMDAWAKALDCERVLAWFGRAASAGLSLGPASRSAALEVLGAHGESDVAAKCVQDMEIEGVRPSTGHFNALLGGCALRGDVLEGSRWFDEMGVRGLTPDLQSYNLMMSICTRAGDNHGARRWLQSCKAAGLRPDVVSYSTVLEGVGRARVWQDALQVLDEMMVESVKASSICYLPLIDAAARMQDIVMVQRWFQRMATDRVMPSTECFNAVLSAAVATRSGLSARWLAAVCGDEATTQRHSIHHLKRSCLQLGTQVLKIMASRDAQPDVITITQLIKASAKQGDMKAAKHWLREMEEKRLEPDAICCNAVLDAFVKGDDITGAQDWLLERQKHTTRSPSPSHRWPDLVSYNIVLGGLAVKSRLSEASALLSSLPSKSMMPSVATYNALINGCAEAKNPQQAAQWLEEMTAAKLRADAESHNALLKAWARSGDCEAALSQVQQCKRLSIQPDCVAYTTVISCFARCSKRQVSSNLLEQMQRELVIPDIITYNALLMGHSRAGDVQAALQMLEGLSSKRLDPDVETWTNLIGACAHAKPPNGAIAEDMLQVMLKQSILPSHKTVAMLEKAVGKQRQQSLLSGVARTNTRRRGRGGEHTRAAALSVRDSARY